MHTKRLLAFSFLVATAVVVPVTAVSAGEPDHGHMTTTTVTAPRAVPTTTVMYKNCGQVRSAGKAPLLRGQPGYRPELDTDNDGIACEVGKPTPTVTTPMTTTTLSPPTTVVPPVARPRPAAPVKAAPSFTG